MIKEIFKLSFTFLILSSCNYKVEANFEITNKTGYNIDSLKIEPNTNKLIKYISLKKNEKVDYKSDMTSIPKTDGEYQVSFLINGVKKIKVFGYYTNGYPLEKRTNIEIRKDNILIDQVFE